MAKKGHGYTDFDSNGLFANYYKVPVFIKVRRFASTDAYVAGNHGPLITPHTEE